jgi:hypothetical protein
MKRARLLVTQCLAASNSAFEPREQNVRVQHMTRLLQNFELLWLEELVMMKWISTLSWHRANTRHCLLFAIKTVYWHLHQGTMQRKNNSTCKTRL